MSKLRFGLLGTGPWAPRAHGAALAASPHATLQGVWGRDPAKADDLAGQLGTRSYDDLDKLFSDVDAVALALPPDVQAELAVRAARAGCHLLLDKPMALSVPAAEAVVRAVDDAGVASVVFFTNRFQPEVERWAEAAAEAGPWHSAHLVHYANIFQPGNPYGRSDWRRQRGALWDIGPHGLATVLPVMGPVSSVAARRGRAGTDTVHMVLTHGPPGSPPSEPASASTLSLSLTMPPAATGCQLVLYGEHGTRARPEGTLTGAEASQNAIAELAGLVSSGYRHHRCDVRFGLEVVRVLSAAEAAIDRAATGVDD